MKYFIHTVLMFISIAKHYLYCLHVSSGVSDWLINLIRRRWKKQLIG